VQKYFMRTRMHGTPTGRPDYEFHLKMSEWQLFWISVSMY